MFHPKVMLIIRDLELVSIDADHITPNAVTVGDTSICFGHAVDVVTIGGTQHRCTLPRTARAMFYEAIEAEFGIKVKPAS